MPDTRGLPGLHNFEERCGQVGSKILSQKYCKFKAVRESCCIHSESWRTILITCDLIAIFNLVYGLISDIL